MHPKVDTQILIQKKVKNKNYQVKTRGKIKLELDNNCHITRILKTGLDDKIQIIANDQNFMYVITWDLENNIEHCMMQLENKYGSASSHFVFKGISEHLNYIPYNDSLIDLRFGLPFKFFKGLKLPTSTI